MSQPWMQQKEEERAKLKEILLAGLPEPENLLEKTKDYALDRLQEAKKEGDQDNVEHYTRVLERLTKITKR